MSDPRLFLWSWTALQNAKSLAADGDPSVQPAIDRLQSEVNNALEFEPATVMSKELVPPSGDKHDYMSQGPYWWPDPDQPDGLPYIRRDGEVNPEVESLDSRKQGRMIAALETLALGWYFFDNAKAADRGTQLIRTWFIDPETRMNPHLEYGQGIPGHCDGRGIGIIDTASYCRLIEAIGLLEVSGAITDMDRSDLLMWMKAYRDWLVASDKGRDEARACNNHGTWYDAQLCALAHYTGDPRIVAKVAEEAKEHRIATQIEPDGSQPKELARTLSQSYTTMNTIGFMTIARYAEATDIDLWSYETNDGRGIRKAVDFLVPYVVNGERWTWQQITDFDQTSLVPLLKRAAIGFNDPSYLDLIQFLPEDAAANRAHLCVG
mgnify:FL=1